MQMTVAQLRIFPEQSMGERVAVGRAMRLDAKGAARQAEHEMTVEPDTVYLLPPMKEMIIKGRKLLLSDRDPRHGLALPIDHFFRSLADTLGAAINIKVAGDNTHHMIEACFKGLGRALRQALRVTDTELPSTKGTL